MANTLGPLSLGLNNTCPDDERSTNMTDHRISRYRHTRLYILDDKDPNAEDEDMILGVPTNTPHDQKIKYVLAIFLDLFAGVEINRVYFNQQATEDTWNEYWEKELARCTTDDLLIIYYHGLAGNEDFDYSWNFENPPHDRPINAYRFIQTIHNSPADALFILDCWIQTRFSRKWSHHHHTDPPNLSTTEIIAAPAQYQDPEGSRLRHRRDFTEALAMNLGIYHQKLKGDGGAGPRALQSVLQVLASDKKMYSNPIRIWLQRTTKRKRGRERVRRFKLDPQLIRLTGVLEIFAQEIQSVVEE